MNSQPYADLIHDLYLDVTGDEAARRQVKAVPELASAFEALGFRSIGFYRIGQSEPANIFEVWRSPDSRAVLTVEYDQNRRARAELRTLLHDGTIIDTSSGYSGRARLFCRSRVHHPESGYLMETSNAAPEALWRRHAERVETLSRERQTSLPVHDTLRMHLALSGRSYFLSAVRRMFGRRIEWMVLIPATLLIVLAMVIAHTPLHWLTAVAVAGVAFWYVGEVSTWAAARLMRIPSAPLAVLLSAVDEADAAREAPPNDEAVSGTGP
ncbi:hypothetical protein ACLESD_08050 [Pyxidicoccus sp. 3LFB2]